jgi:hypothetical protein
MWQRLNCSDALPITCWGRTSPRTAVPMWCTQSWTQVCKTNCATIITLYKPQWTETNLFHNFWRHPARSSNKCMPHFLSGKIPACSQPSWYPKVCYLHSSILSQQNVASFNVSEIQLRTGPFQKLACSLLSVCKYMQDHICISVFTAVLQRDEFSLRSLWTVNVSQINATKYSNTW